MIPALEWASTPRPSKLWGYWTASPRLPISSEIASGGSCHNRASKARSSQEKNEFQYLISRFKAI